MGLRSHRIVVCGRTRSGKSTMLSILCGPPGQSNDKILQQPYIPTIEDIYTTNAFGTDTLYFHEIGQFVNNEFELPRHYLTMADAFIFVFAFDDIESLAVLEKVKRDVDKYLSKEKRDIPLGLVGCKADLAKDKSCQVSREAVDAFVKRERLNYYEVTSRDDSSPANAFATFAKKLIPVAKDQPTRFPLRARSLKDRNPGGPAILMDM